MKKKLSATQEIQYLGSMLTATTHIDKNRIRAIIQRLNEINKD